MITSFKQIIDDWPGGRTGFASDIGVPVNNVKQMLRRDSIPPSHWPRTVERAESRNIRGISLGLLARLRAAKNQQVEHSGRSAARRAERRGAAQ